MNIYVFGKAIGVYRTQNFIKLVLEKTNYKLFFNDFQMERKSSKIHHKILFRLKKYFFEMMDNKFIINRSDIVYQTAMNEIRVPYHKIHLKKKYIISEFYISFYDTYVNDRKIFDSKSREAEKMLKRDQDLLLKSDLVIFLNKSEMEYYTKILHIDSKNINYKIVPLCIDNQERFCKLKYFKNQKEKLTICWWGTFIPLHGLEKILKAAKLLMEKGINYELYIFGDSDIKAEPYKKLVVQYGIDNFVKFNNSYTFKNGKLTNFLIENCDVVLGTFGESEKAKTVIANKIIDGIALKAPVITGKSSGLCEFFDGNNDIYMIDNDSVQLVETIIQITQKNLDIIQTNVEKARCIYQEFFSPESYQKKMYKILNEIEVNTQK